MAQTRRSRDHAIRFHGLADGTRFRILELLRSGEHCVCELTEALELSQSLLSFHLKTLKQAGLVTDRRQGRWMYYALNEGAIEEMASVLREIAGRPRRPRAGRRCD